MCLLLSLWTSRMQARILIYVIILYSRYLERIVAWSLANGRSLIFHIYYIYLIIVRRIDDYIVRGDPEGVVSVDQMLCHSTRNDGYERKKKTPSNELWIANFCLCSAFQYRFNVNFELPMYKQIKGRGKNDQFATRSNQNNLISVKKEN